MAFATKTEFRVAGMLPEWMNSAALFQGFNITLIFYGFGFAALVLVVLWPAVLLRWFYRKTVKRMVAGREPEASAKDAENASSREGLGHSDDPRVQAIARRYNQSAPLARNFRKGS